MRITYSREALFALRPQSSSPLPPLPQALLDPTSSSRWPARAARPGPPSNNPPPPPPPDPAPQQQDDFALVPLADDWLRPHPLLGEIDMGSLEPSRHPPSRRQDAPAEQRRPRLVAAARPSPPPESSPPPQRSAGPPGFGPPPGFALRAERRPGGGGGASDEVARGERRGGVEEKEKKRTGKKGGEGERYARGPGSEGEGFARRIAFAAAAAARKKASAASAASAASFATKKKGMSEIDRLFGGIEVGGGGMLEHFVRSIPTNVKATPPPRTSGRAKGIEAVALEARLVEEAAEVAALSPSSTTTAPIAVAKCVEPVEAEAAVGAVPESSSPALASTGGLAHWFASLGSDETSTDISGGESVSSPGYKPAARRPAVVEDKESVQVPAAEQLAPDVLSFFASVQAGCLPGTVAAAAVANLPENISIAPKARAVVKPPLPVASSTTTPLSSSQPLRNAPSAMPSIPGPAQPWLGMASTARDADFSGMSPENSSQNWGAQPSPLGHPSHDQDCQRPYPFMPPYVGHPLPMQLHHQQLAQQHQQRMNPPPAFAAPLPSAGVGWQHPSVPPGYGATPGSAAPAAPQPVEQTARVTEFFNLFQKNQQEHLVQHQNGPAPGAQQQAAMHGPPGMLPPRGLPGMAGMIPPPPGLARTSNNAATSTPRNL